MNRGALIIILSVLLVAIAGTIVLVIVANQQPSIPEDWERRAKPINPAETALSDERILRLTVQLNASDGESRDGAILELAGLAEDNPERLGPVLLEALNNGDAKVRFLAANKLGVIKYVAAAGALTTLLDDPEVAVNSQAVESLVKLDQVGLEAVMVGLAENRIRNIDGALDAVSRISGKPFRPGEKGRQEALKYWAEQNKQDR